MALLCFENRGSYLPTLVKFILDNEIEAMNCAYDRAHVDWTGGIDRCECFVTRKE